MTQTQLRFRRDPLSVCSWLEREIESGRQAPRGAYRLLMRLAWAHALRGETRQAEARRKEAQRLSYAPGSVSWDEISIDGYANVNLAFHRGEWESVIAEIEEHRERFEARGSLWNSTILCFRLAELASLGGDRPGAIEWLHKMLGPALASGHVAYEMIARSELAQLLALDGHVEQAQEHLDGCRAILDAGEDWGGQTGRVHLAAGLVAAARGDQPAADGEIDAALAVFEAHQLPWDEADTLLLRAQVCRASDVRAASLDAAEDIYRRLEAGDAWVERVKSERRSV